VALDLLMGFVLMAGVPAYFIAQPVALIFWRGRWRLAAMAPLLLSVPALVFSLYALAMDSNLWPLTLIFAAALGMIYLAVLWAVRMVRSL
jgi:hypothetical protein